jgi:hypothetical protein
VGTGTEERRLYYALVTDWPDGEYALTTDIYAAGTHRQIFVVGFGG